MANYVVKYRVTGYDHDSYCSDAEGQEVDPYDVYEIEKYAGIKNYRSDGCTTDGSGYCTGCYQNYTVKGLYKLTDEDMDFIFPKPNPKTTYSLQKRLIEINNEVKMYEKIDTSKKTELELTIHNAVLKTLQCELSKVVGEMNKIRHDEKVGAEALSKSKYKVVYEKYDKVVPKNNKDYLFWDAKH